MKIKRFIAWALGVVAAVAVIGAHAQPKAIELEFPSWQIEEAGAGEYWTELIKAFEAVSRLFQLRSYMAMRTFCISRSRSLSLRSFFIYLGRCKYAVREKTRSRRKRLRSHRFFLFDRSNKLKVYKNGYAIRSWQIRSK